MGSASASRPCVPSKAAKRDLRLFPRASPPPENPRNSGAGDMEGTLPCGSSAVAPYSFRGPLSVDGADVDAALQQAEFLTREEVLRRRHRRVRQLARYYRRQYWALMEAVRARHRDYYWNFGRSPTERDETEGGVGEGAGNGGGAVKMVGAEGSGENGRMGLGFGAVEGLGKRKGANDRCAYPGCKTKPMALTRYCHLHILSDSNQKLYKPCTYAIKSSQSGPITCGKPVLRASAISYCPSHFQKAQRHVSQALKKAGLPQNSGRPSPKFHVLIAEFVRQIQAKRRELLRVSVEDVLNRDETGI